MSFSASWRTLLENVEELPPDATLFTPLSRKPFAIKDVQEPRILISYREDDETIPLDREQFETLSGCHRTVHKVLFSQIQRRIACYIVPANRTEGIHYSNRPFTHNALSIQTTHYPCNGGVVRRGYARRLCQRS
jgi:hypothetical protein